jgi:hypothetical protein
VAGDDAVFVFWDFDFHICMSLMPNQSLEPMRGIAGRSAIAGGDVSPAWLILVC